MTKHLTTSDLPEPVARFAQAQIAAGRFSTVEDVLTAGVEALRERDERQNDWQDYAGHRFAEGRAAFARGDVLETTPDELMDGIEKELGIAP